jgi:hypothetical protein
MLLQFSAVPGPIRKDPDWAGIGKTNKTMIV